MTFIENQKWRYATKKFEASKIISDENLLMIKEAIQLSTSSYGLQPYQIIIVENKELRQQMLPHCWNQNQVVDASHLLVFANFIKVEEKHIDNYFLNISKTRGITIEDLKGYSDFMKSNILILPENVCKSWTSKQAYLALGNLINICADLKIDCTPMEGFEPQEINKILNLEEKNLNAVLLAPIGYRHVDDISQNYVKVRKPMEELFLNL
jgi:nitroreductase